MKTIGTEEHFVTDEVVTAWSRLDSPARDDSRASIAPGEVDERLREETGMPIYVADNPLDSVVLGTGKCVEDFETLRQVLVPESRR